MLQWSRLFRFFRTCCSSTTLSSSPILLAHPSVLITFPSLPSPSRPCLFLSSRLFLRPPSAVLLFPSLPFPFVFFSGIFGSFPFVLVLFPRLLFVCDLPCESQCPMTLGGHTYLNTVAILAQGRHWPLAHAQAFLHEVKPCYAYSPFH